LTLIELGRFSSCITQSCESGASGCNQAILTSGECELGRARAKDKAAIEVAGNKSMMFKSDSEPVSCRTGDSCHSDKLCEGVGA
jgi:hypothetical protein